MPSTRSPIITRHRRGRAGGRGAEGRFAVRGMVAAGHRMCAQTEWIGVTEAGTEIRAHICSVLDLVESKIWRQEEYDCFL